MTGRGRDPAPRARRDDLGLTAREFAQLARLNSPPRIQEFVSALAANHEPHGETVHSVRNVLRHRVAHCIEGALLAACALWVHGEPPLVMHLDCAPHDNPHVVALFRRGRSWGALSKSNGAWLRYREPVYRTLRELAMSYFHEFFDKRGHKTLRSYSAAFDLRRIDPALWVTAAIPAGPFTTAWQRCATTRCSTPAQARDLSRRDTFERRSARLVQYPPPFGEALVKTLRPRLLTQALRRRAAGPCRPRRRRRHRARRRARSPRAAGRPRLGPRLVPRAAPSRAQVASLYNDVYVPGSAAALVWTGSVAGCLPGTTNLEHQQAVVARINYFRALVDLPAVQLLTGLQTTQVQAAALMMSANNALSHQPPMSWLCFTGDGATGAANANIALGARGVEAIDLYMDDFGAGNAAVGHRRWLLHPPRASMATGDTTGGNMPPRPANAVYVFGPQNARPATPNGVAWPPAGFVPYQNLPNRSNRWSFSFPGANFASATVTMSGPAGPIPVTFEPLATGFGDNTIVFLPSNFDYTKPSADTTYTVQVSGMTGAGVPATIQYTVTVIDPATAPPSAVPVTVVEFYNQALDHYFITWVAAEIAATRRRHDVEGLDPYGQDVQGVLDEPARHDRHLPHLHHPAAR